MTSSLALPATCSVALHGPAPQLQGSGVVIQGNSSSAPFISQQGSTHQGTLTIKDVTIQGFVAGAMTLLGNTEGHDTWGFMNFTRVAFHNNGCTASAPKSTSQGGAIFNKGGYVTAVDCTFTGNIAKDSGGAVSSKHGIFHCVKCRFDGNQAVDLSKPYPGGAGGQGGAVNNVLGDFSCIDCVFTKNKALNSGAGGAISSQGNTNLTNVELSENVAGQGGGALYHSLYALHLSNCQFNSNTVSGWQYHGKDVVQGGGAIYSDVARVDSKNNTFENNTAVGAKAYGGAIYIHLGDGWPGHQVTFKGDRLRHNSAGFHGGGLFARSASKSGALSALALSNITLAANSAGGCGGGVLVYGLDLEMTSCRFVANKASKGGGYCQSTSSESPAGNTNQSNATLDSNYFKGNVASEIGPVGGDLHFDDGGTGYTNVAARLYCNTYSSMFPGPPEPAGIDIVPCPEKPRKSSRAGPIRAFKHPGVLVTMEMLSEMSMRATKNVPPQAAALRALQLDKRASLDWKAKPRATVACGSYSHPDLGCRDEINDATAAYAHSLLWATTKDSRHATKAMGVMDAWSAVIKNHTLSNAPLQAGWAASLWTRAAEIIRYSPGLAGNWSLAPRFAQMLRSVYMPLLIHGTSANGNWELTFIEGLIGIAVFTNDEEHFQLALDMWRKRVPAYIYMSSDGPYPNPDPHHTAWNKHQIESYWCYECNFTQTVFKPGMSQETCRDLGHTQMGFAAMWNVAETAHHQGVDLYGEELHRITTGMEFHARLLLEKEASPPTPAPSWLCRGNVNGGASPTWEIALNHYTNRANISLPQTTRQVLGRRPTGTDLMMAWETLTHGSLG